ncbi:hypothetical protein [Micromonospora sp. NPDC023633]|uniref:hypothetical protein n=1 Tax=Micromonospora sp. NPDC023633 TaxID=3154320 RepID=UPI0033ECA145
MTTIPAQRVGTVRYLLADLATAAFGPDHPGADEHWLDQLRTAAAVSWPDRTPTAVIPAIRRPAAALAAVAYRLVDVPYLGVLPIGPLEPARIANHLAAVNGVNTREAL